MAAAFVEELAYLRKRIRSRIEEVNGMTEREVLGAGNSVHGIVTRAGGHIREIRLVLSGITGGFGDATSSRNAIATSIAAQSAVLSEHVADLTARAAAQDDCAGAARAESKVILSTAGLIAKLAREARTLALNARIEASRSGGSGMNGFGVIAAEMQRLSNEVAAANTRVQDVAVRLGEVLPVVADQAREIRDHVGTFAVA